ncbi:sulfate ABC transporter substrate-binding protein [Pseudanabaena sp. PCC 6802]|uniref:sulfate ABC transporter substrate-binding protein n=1 Tax=Pseudanabaena sp. PCC 6802 TaxID=118173 RepID=UPI00034B45D4|nr:sulfate ABC transporter substrate-binding protein [Pseudanabaena sp. PCC 6802]
MHLVWRNFRKWLSLFGVGLFLAAAIAACGPQANQSSPADQSSPTVRSSSPKEAKITLVSYAVTKAAYAKIIPLFVAEWEQKTGQKVTVKESYGGSGAQTRAIIDGLEADVVNLALEGDVNKLQKAGLIDEGWQKELPNDSIVTKSVVALSYRDGNPKGIKSWDDVVKPGVEIITANPKTSGVAKWNFLAVYGAAREKLKDDGKAQEFVQKFYQNAKVLAKDAREATEVFAKQGQGDLLLNYENEVILAEKEGKKIPFVVPTNVNISIDTPATVVDTNVKKHGTEAVAKAFAEFLFTAPAQREFTALGFRSVLPEVESENKDRFPKIEKLLTVKDFGGWDGIEKQFFAKGAVFDRIQASLGK